MEDLMSKLTMRQDSGGPRHYLDGQPVPCGAYRERLRESHGIRYPYIAGAMANGIGSGRIVESMSPAASGERRLHPNFRR